MELLLFIGLITAIMFPIAIYALHASHKINLAEYKEKPSHFSDLLIWNAILPDGTIINKDGSFQKSFSYRGSDLDSATTQELDIVSARINNVLKRLSGGWCLFADAERVKSNKYMTAQFPDTVTYLIDNERKKSFESGTHYESNYFLTFLYLPPEDAQDKLSSLLVEKSTNGNKQTTDYRKYFEKTVYDMQRLFAEVLCEFDEMTAEQTLTYLHSIISNKKHTIKYPEVPLYIDAQLADTPVIPGLEPKLGNLKDEHHIRAISVISFPGESSPGILDALNRLGFEYRWSTRYIALDKEDATKQISTIMKKWYSKRKGIKAMVSEWMSGQESIVQDNDAVNKANECDLALIAVANDEVSYGYANTTIIIKEKDENMLEKKIRAIEKTINGLGFTTIVETLNGFEAWLGTIPGHARQNPRRPLWSTLNLAHLMPISAIWAGNETNDHLDHQPPHIYCITSGNTPYRLNLNIQDLGHTMIVGPPGSGKSTLLSLLAAQFPKYKQSQVYCFDKGYSMLPLTAGVGGEFYDLGKAESGLCFQPLANIDNENEASWAFEWILSIIAQENLPINPDIKSKVWQAITSLALSPKEERTLSGLTYLVQDNSIRQAIAPYTNQGSLGHLLDSNTDSLGTATWQLFEMETLMNTKMAVMPTLTYLFHKLEQRFRKGHPAILILDEAWVFLDNPIFSAKIREWLKVLRKNDVYVVFASQSLSDVVNSSIFSALIDSCPTQIFLPNAKAQDEQNSKIYESFGLNERQIQLISIATPKRHYFYKSSIGSRIFDLGLGPMELAYCASAGKESYDKITKIIKEHGKDKFNHEWLREKSDDLYQKYLQAIQR